MKHWLQAFRLRTLPLAVSSIIVGSALAFEHSRLASYGPDWRLVTILALLTAILLQILSNLANDLGDYKHGTDNADRVGPQRTVQSGAISPSAMKRAMVICGSLAFFSGCALIVVAFGFTFTTLAFLVLGLLAIGAAVKYTFGKNPYGYAGLGDISVFLFFGIVGVCGTFFLHTGTLEKSVILPSVSLGLLSAGVLNLNNMRDIDNDRASGKRTIPVRIGSTRASIYHSRLIVGGIAAMIASTIENYASVWQWMIILPVGLLLAHWYREDKIKQPRNLDPELKRLAMATFLTALLFSLGIILAV
jgi:1,4-dihydroxy-2-naphthoate polyprenyltransferase